MPKASTTTGTQKWLSVRMALTVDDFKFGTPNRKFETRKSKFE
jgi:hypothetical protein